MDEHSEKFNRVKKNIKKNQRQPKNTVAEMKNTLGRIK